MTSKNLLSREFIGLITGRVVSTFNASILAVAVGWHLYQFTGDAFDLALVSLFQIVPIISLFMLTGWVADNFSRRLIIQLSTLLQVVVMICVAMIMSMEIFNKWYLFCALLISGVSRAFMAPAIQSIIPNIVHEEKLSQAVSIYSFAWNLALAVAPVLAGLLLVFLDLNIYWVLVCTGLFGLLAFSLLPKIYIEQKKDFSFKELLGGVHYLRKNRQVFGALAMDLLIVLFGSVVVLLPVIVSDVLEAGPEALGILRAMPAVGSSLIGFYFSFNNNLSKLPGKKLFIALFVFSFSILLIAISENFYLVALGLLIYGGSDMISVIVRSNIIQLLTPDELRGRVNSLNGIFIASSNELGDFRAAAMATVVGPTNSLMIGGFMALGITLWGARYFKELFNIKTLDKTQE